MKAPNHSKNLKLFVKTLFPAVQVPTTIIRKINHPNKSHKVFQPHQTSLLILSAARNQKSFKFLIMNMKTTSTNRLYRTVNKIKYSYLVINTNYLIKIINLQSKRTYAQFKAEHFSVYYPSDYENTYSHVFLKNLSNK